VSICLTVPRFGIQFTSQLLLSARNLTPSWGQGRIDHWANRANARGLALLGALRLNIKTLLYWFFMFLGCSPRVKIAELVELLRLVHRLRKLTTLQFVAFEELNQTAPRFMTQELDRNQCIQVCRRFFRGKLRNLAYLFQVADDAMQKTFTKRFTLSTPLVCAGWTSILNLLFQMFSTFRLSEMLFLFINCLISIFRTLPTNKS